MVKIIIIIMNQDVITFFIGFAAVGFTLYHFTKQLSAFSAKKQKPDRCAGCSDCPIRELKNVEHLIP